MSPGELILKKSLKVPKALLEIDLVREKGSHHRGGEFEENRIRIPALSFELLIG